MRYLVLILSIVCMSASCEQQRIEALDNGRMVVNDNEVYPAFTPWQVVIDPSVDGPDGFDRMMITHAINWMNAELSRDGESRIYFELVSSSSGEIGTITVEAGYTGDGGDFLEEEDIYPGIFKFDYDEDSRILYGTIVISSDITYHEDTVFAVLQHELGHCLGLDDDPGPPATVDLNSIMASPLVIDGELTDHDFQLVIGEET